MLSWIKRIFALGALLLLIGSSSAVMGQTFTIDTEDGRVDPAWANVPAFVFGDTELSGGEVQFGDIVSAWFVADKDDPETLYFRVDGYDLIDSITLDLDCDNDGSFNGEPDRSILFSTLGDPDTGGEVEGTIEYTKGYLASLQSEITLDSFLYAYGEFEVYDEDDLYQGIEAELDLGEDEDGVMAPCLTSRADGNWQISYRYDSPFEQTPVGTQDIRTAVTLSQQSADTLNTARPLGLAFLLMSSLTFSLLFVYSYRKRKIV